MNALARIDIGFVKQGDLLVRRFVDGGPVMVVDPGARLLQQPTLYLINRDLECFHQCFVRIRDNDDVGLQPCSVDIVRCTLLQRSPVCFDKVVVLPEMKRVMGHIERQHPVLRRYLTHLSMFHNEPKGLSVGLTNGAVACARYKDAK